MIGVSLKISEIDLWSEKKDGWYLNTQKDYINLTRDLANI